MIEKSNMPQREDLDVPKDLACMFYFACDGKFSKVLVAGKKRWPDNMTLSEKLSLSEGDFITLKCGPKYNVEAQGEFVLQGSEKHVTRAISKICVLRESGHDVSQIEAQKIFDEVLKKDKPIFPESQDDDVDFVPASPETRGKKVPRLQKDVAIFDDDEVPDEPNIDCKFYNEFLEYTKAKKDAGPSSARKTPESQRPSAQEVIISSIVSLFKYSTVKF